MRILILALCFTSYEWFAGCPPPEFTSSIPNVNSGMKFSGTYFVFVNPADSFTVSVTYGQKNCIIFSAKISFNNKIVIPDAIQGKAYKLPCSLGEYLIEAEKGPYNKGAWRIIFMIKPKVDTTSTWSGNTALLQVKTPNPDFLLYPNPAISKITIENESDELKNVQIYNTTGTLLYENSEITSKLVIPLKDYPEGIYILRAATLTDKVIVRKFILR